MTSSNGNIFRVTGPLCGEFTGPGEFSTQSSVTRSFDLFFDLRLNKRFSKQLWGWWFETPPLSLWHHCNVFSFLFLNGLKHSNEIQWNLNKIEKGLFLENRLHNVSCITTVILFRIQCVNELLRNPLLYTFSNLLHSVNYKILKRKMASMQITILSISNFSLCFCFKCHFNFPSKFM